MDDKITIGVPYCIKCIFIYYHLRDLPNLIFKIIQKYVLWYLNHLIFGQNKMAILRFKISDLKLVKHVVAMK